MIGGIPDHVAGYAAGLHSGSLATWAHVAEAVARAGLGVHRFDELAKAAITWERANVAPAAKSLLKAIRHTRPKLPAPPRPRRRKAVRR